MRGDISFATGSSALVPNMSLTVDQEQAMENYNGENWIEVSPSSGRAAMPRQENEWAMDHGSVVAEAGTSYAVSDVTVDTMPGALSLPEGVNMAATHLLPESFEEQMMLAMAVSLAEARARTCPQGLTWM